jgi:DNA replication protein DnaC
MTCPSCKTPTLSDNLCLKCRKAQATQRYTPETILPLEVPRIIVKKLSKEISDSHVSESLFIHGPAGSGKSHMAACLMYQTMCNNSPEIFSSEFAWVNVPKLLFDIRQTYNNKELQGEEQRLLEKYSRIHWLCLDDLGAEKTSDWSLQTLYLIINARYENERTTVITSNLSTEELAVKMEDDRLSSRISGMCRVIELNGKDRRK